MENLLFYFVFLFGLILGSFLNCLIWRLYSKESILGRSYCPNCRHQLAWYDNIPVLSFIFLKGKCRHCQQSISRQYPLVELSLAILFSLVFIFWRNSFSLLAINDYLSLGFILHVARDWIFIFLLVLVFVYDLRWQKIPMLAIWPGIFFVALFSLLLGTPLHSLLLAIFLGASFFLIQYLVTRGKGLGSGDIYLGALLGARFVILSHLGLAIFSSYMIGSSVAIFLVLKNKKKMKSRLALGPFLVLGALISLFFAKEILTWYLSLLAF